MTSRTVTRIASAGPDRLAHRLLHPLAAVKDPVASALPTVAGPQRFTVIDVLALRTLRVHGEITELGPAYDEYLN